ncbi:hypothetical protein BH09SUM1_BH09SUM1_25960 [soil metagenome]
MKDGNEFCFGRFAYLELAIRRGLPMASLDMKPMTACISEGVPRFK